MTGRKLTSKKFEYNKNTKEITPKNWDGQEKVLYPQIVDLVNWFVNWFTKNSNSIGYSQNDNPSANLYLIVPKDNENSVTEYPICHLDFNNGNVKLGKFKIGSYKGATGHLDKLEKAWSERPKEPGKELTELKDITNTIEFLVEYIRNYYAEDQFDFNAIFKLLQNTNQIILSGPPGTGKTHLAKRLATYLVAPGMFGNSDADRIEKLKTIPNSDLDTILASYRFCNAAGGGESHNKKPDSAEAKGKWDIIQFHPSYQHEDLVRGIAVHTNGGIKYEVENKIFAQMAKQAMESALVQNNKMNAFDEIDMSKLIKKYLDLNKEQRKKAPPYVLIIDEINRAPLASVLGELIYGLEYRGETIKTPYAIDENYDFMIPENMYVIGTMNTADRSIGSIDYAVRRRFSFVHCPAHKDNLSDKGKKYYELIEEHFFNEDFLATGFKKDDIMPGAAYFRTNTETNAGDDELIFKMKYQLLPLLFEYMKDGLLLRKKVEKKLEAMRAEDPSKWPERSLKK